MTKEAQMKRKDNLEQVCTSLRYLRGEDRNFKTTKKNQRKLHENHCFRKLLQAKGIDDKLLYPPSQR